PMARLVRLVAPEMLHHVTQWGSRRHVGSAQLCGTQPCIVTYEGLDMNQHVSDGGDLGYETGLHRMADRVTFGNADSRVHFNMNIHEILQSSLADVQLVNAIHARYGKCH